MNTTKCSRCKKAKSTSLFYKGDSYKGGTSSWCKECHKKSSRKQAEDGYFRERNQLIAKSPKACLNCKRTLQSEEFIKHANSRSRNCKTCITKLSEALRQKKANRDVGSKKFTPLQLLASDMHNNCRKRSAKMNLPFNLTREFIYQLLEKFCKEHKHSLDNLDPFKPSIDRKKSSLGYTKKNVRIIWLIENYAKNRFNDEQVLEFCKRKLENHK